AGPRTAMSLSMRWPPPIESQVFLWMRNRPVEFGFIISRGDKRSVELAIPQDMQCKPGVAFITEPMTKGTSIL
ncbi:MAG TPA: hypothetical protein VIM99_11755, partial [Blastocatellia bacterium]